MSKPYKCPSCEGTGKVLDVSSTLMKSCHSCSGRGVVWEPETLKPESITPSGPKLERLDEGT